MILGSNCTRLYAGDSQPIAGTVTQIAVLSHVAIVRVRMALGTPITPGREGQIERGGFGLAPLSYRERRVLLDARLVA